MLIGAQHRFIVCDFFMSFLFNVIGHHSTLGSHYVYLGEVTRMVQLNYLLAHMSGVTCMLLC